MKSPVSKIVNIVLLSLLFSRSIFPQSRSAGIFDDHNDIGMNLNPGSVQYDSLRSSCTVTGGGENMWFSHDAFHFVWKKMSGNISLDANIKWTTTGGHTHKKACLIIRQNLESNSAYAAAALHSDGLTSLQYRETAGDLTHEIQSNIKKPERLCIEKEGDYVSMAVARENGALQSAGGSFRIKFSEPFYVGLGVCAHDSNALATAVFSNVEITNIYKYTKGEPMLESTLETITIASTDRKVVYKTHEHIEAPNWSRNGKYFLFNSNGRIYRLPMNSWVPQLIETRFATHCNNDHGISPDGKLLAISDQTGDDISRICILPIDGGEPRIVTPDGPSYWHSWSPDGKTIAYCAKRGQSYDIYTIQIDGGEEKRLTMDGDLNDGPDYSPDGQYIYFNSNRNGLMQIWRMKSDGSEQEQITSDEYNNWFPHPSPDGNWIVFLSYEKDTEGHPANKDVMLRLMPASGGEIKVLTKLFGGQGTMNVPSWSPNSDKLAFVSYKLVNP
jgi:TolB protein